MWFTFILYFVSASHILRHVCSRTHAHQALQTLRHDTIAISQLLFYFKGTVSVHSSPTRQCVLCSRKLTRQITARSEKGETAILPDLAFLEDSTTTIQDGV